MFGMLIIIALFIGCSICCRNREKRFWMEIIHPEMFERGRDFKDFGCAEDLSSRYEDKEGWDLFKNNG